MGKGSAMEEKVAAALARIPRLSGLGPDAVTYERLGGLTNLVYRLQAGDEDYVLRIPGEGTEDYIDRKVEDDDRLFLVAIDGSQVVGSVMGGYDGHRGWVNYLAVEPARRRTGIGRRLMDEVERLLDDVGCAKVNLQIRQGNAGVVAFYERLGYATDPVVSMGKRLVDDTGSSS